MIISASRRTDIPACYSVWFLNRLRQGFALVRNPRNYHQIRRIDLRPEAVDGLVLWTKNPLPLLDHLSELAAYPYYVQFTITAYGQDLEPNLPDKNAVILPAFRRLAETVGAERVIWRYDPILLNAAYSPARHLDAFGKIAETLAGYTRQVVISFLDVGYRGVRIGDLADFPPSAQRGLSFGLARIAQNCGLTIKTCAEAIDLEPLGIRPGRCIDPELLEKQSGRSVKASKARGQRPECACAQSYDLGMYNTCFNACRYCYANYSPGAVAASRAVHDPNSPLLRGWPEAVC